MSIRSEICKNYQQIEINPQLLYMEDNMSLQNQGAHDRKISTRIERTT